MRYTSSVSSDCLMIVIIKVSPESPESLIGTKLCFAWHCDDDD